MKGKCFICKQEYDRVDDDFYYISLSHIHLIEKTANKTVAPVINGNICMDCVNKILGLVKGE